jgi:predicted DNA-binding transcriptional regulator YafY
LLKACREGLRLETEYVSLNTPNVEVRLIAPHTLVYTGMRWHVRAYCEKNGQYRDFAQPPAGPAGFARRIAEHS